MPDFKKILDHPQKDKIISKLAEGETPKNVSQYLKLKYSDDSESHLRLPATLLKEFSDKYFQEGGTLTYIKKIIKDEQSGKLDKTIASSLLNNKSWRDRIAEHADKEIDFKKKIQQLVVMIEARVEQVFDKIQQQPGNFKGDYVLINYFDKLLMAVEKADKIVNEKPDQTIEHIHSVQVIEQHSVAFQEAIRRVLAQLDPATSAVFMDLLQEELSKMSEKDIIPKPLTQNQKNKEMDKVEKLIEGEFEDV